MACPPTPPTGVDPAATSDDIRNLIEAASQTAVNGRTQQDRDQAYVRMLMLQQYMSDLVNCHMTLHIQNLTTEVVALRTALGTHQ